MKPSIYIAILCALVGALSMRGAPTGGNLEQQLRLDLDTFIRAKAPKPVDDGAVAKTVEKLAAQVKESFPGILIADSSIQTPSEEALQRAYADLQRVGAGAPSPVLVSCYAELWRAKLLKPDQAIIFERLMRAIASATEKQRKDKNG